MLGLSRVGLIIPALNEEGAIDGVVRAVDRSLVDEVVVVDNGSVDRTAERAAAAGALVVREPRRGYGAACLRGIAELGKRVDVYVFMDGDGSDDGSQLPELLGALETGQLDFVLASRTLGQAEPGALTPLQRFGSWLMGALVRQLWDVRYSDLGPFRAIRREALEQLQMRDLDYGWTIEMQVKAAQHQLKIAELPTVYRRRQAGTSKVSGTVVGSYHAGRRILGYVLQAKLEELAGRWAGRGPRA